MSQEETHHNPTVEQLQKLHRRRMAVFGLVILIAGIAIGGAIAIIAMPRPEPSPGPDPTWASLMVAGRLERMLDLAPEPKEKIQLILKATFDTLHEIQEKAKPEIDAEVAKMNELISALLTESQNEKWQRELEDFQRRFREGWRRGGRRGGPGGDPNRSRRGPGGWRSGDPNRPRRGPGFRPDDPNRPRGDFDRYRRGGGSFGRRPRPDDPNRPPKDPMVEPTRPPQ